MMMMMMMMMMILIILFWQLVLATPLFELVKLGDSATLSCLEKCSGWARWILESEERTVAACNQTGCQIREEGFNMSHAQFLQGDLSLSVTAADYSTRSWYSCQCDGKVICRLYLRIQRMDYTRRLEPGDSFTVDFSQISERVKITFNRTAGDGHQEPVTLYKRSENKVQYAGGYEKRALSRSCFILEDVRDSDSGVYTVWDADNHEIIATHTLTLTLTDEHSWKSMNTNIWLGLGWVVAAACIIYIISPVICHVTCVSR